MRRIPQALTGLVLLVGFPLVAPAMAHAAAHITSPVPPLSKGYAFVDVNKPGSFVGTANITGDVRSATDPNGNGTSLRLTMETTIPGFGATTVIVNVDTNTSKPLAPGTWYGGTPDDGSTASIQVGSQTVTDDQNGYAGVRVDQLTDVAGDVTSAAVQVNYESSAVDVTSLDGTMAYAAVPTTVHQGFYTYSAWGTLLGSGNDNYLLYLGLPWTTPHNQPVVGLAQTSDGGGYWMVAADGGVFAYGDATFYGSTGNERLNRPVVGMAATPDGKGYWLVAADGGVFAYGDAAFHGSTGNERMNQPVVGMAATPDGKGYWLVAADGGVFAYGDAAFYGSAGDIRLNQPVVGMAATPDGKGYWLVAADGGVFAYGDAVFHGSTSGRPFIHPVVGMALTADGQGYWLVTSDGVAVNYGDAPSLDSGSESVVGISTVPGTST